MQEDCLYIGIDEAGRGPLAGPVVAAAVYLKTNNFENRIDDSKKLTERQRERAFLEIMDKAYVGLGVLSESAIDELNILNATFFAMSRAVEDLLSRLPKDDFPQADFLDKVQLIVDGNMFKSDLPYKVKTVVKGDQSVKQIACASIIAKVTRDRILTMYDRIFPAYGFKSHKGYPTRAHKEAIKTYGPSLIQRHSFSY